MGHYRPMIQIWMDYWPSVAHLVSKTGLYFCVVCGSMYVVWSMWNTFQITGHFWSMVGPEKHFCFMSIFLNVGQQVLLFT